MFRPAVVDGDKGFELGILCPKFLSKELRLTSIKDVDCNSNQVTFFKEVSNNLHAAHDWSKELMGKPQYVHLKFEYEPSMIQWEVEEFDAGNQKLNVKLQNRQSMTILSVRLVSIERPRREDNKGVTNVHTNTSAKLSIRSWRGRSGR